MEKTIGGTGVARTSCGGGTGYGSNGGAGAVMHLSTDYKDLHKGGEFPAYRCYVNGEWIPWISCPTCNPQKPPQQ